MGMYPSDQRVAFVSPRVIGVGHVDSGVTAVILSLFFSPSFKLAAQSQEISGLEDTVASLRDDYERSLSANSASQKGLQENLISAKHELLRVQEQLSLAEKELDKKFQQTAAYRNMKEILTKKNEQIKDIRKRLQRYEPNE